MIVKTEVKNIRDLFNVACASTRELAAALGVAQPTVSNKLSGRNAWYDNEVDPLLEAIVEPGFVRGVTRTTIMKLLGGPSKIKVRGTMADEKYGGAK